MIVTDLLSGLQPQPIPKTARRHQQRAMNELRDSVRSGHRRVVLQMPTGAGKTFIAAQLVKNSIAQGKRVMFVVPFVALIDQTIEAFRAEGIPDIGVIQGSHPMFDYNSNVQIASLQTLARRPRFPIDLVIVDEAHVGSAVIPKWMKSDPRLRFIGLSATPWRKGMAAEYDDLVIGATLMELIGAKILSDFRVFAPAHPDLKGVKTKAGDFDPAQLSQAMQKGQLMADVVTTWLALGEDRPTLCFAVDRAHAKSLHKVFDSAGVSSAYIDGNTDSVERHLICERFQRGKIRVVVNVGVLTTGIDWDVRCIILARPTKSEMLYVQMVGRGLRTAPGKDDCLILDHADNTLRMGFVTEVGHERLLGGVVKVGVPSKTADRLPKVCPRCNFLRPANAPECPNCGFIPEPQSTVDTVYGELVQVRGKPGVVTAAVQQDWYSQLLAIASERSYDLGWAGYKYKKKFGVWPKGLERSEMTPTREVMNFVKSQDIAFHHRRKSHAT